jgi:hypothetical protein
MTFDYGVEKRKPLPPLKICVAGQLASIHTLINLQSHHHQFINSRVHLHFQFQQTNGYNPTISTISFSSIYQTPKFSLFPLHYPSLLPQIDYLQGFISRHSKQTRFFFQSFEFSVQSYCCGKSR